jgi:hydrogenase maturation protein HypF
MQPPDSDRRERICVVVRGAVQGVGFRPFIYSLAHTHQLTGWVTNSPAGVIIEAEGITTALRRFALSIEADKPNAAVIQSLELTYLDPIGYDDFKIRESLSKGAPTTMVMADLATCSQCLADMAEPSNRRYRYPFTNCTNCGPRYSIILDLPYDRPNTTMRGFTMCEECREEYENPLDRRFHAQPIACPKCGPQLTLWRSNGEIIADKEDAILLAAHELRNGAIIAIKGIGGFQILVDATSETAVQCLRRRKQREEKPFAVMFPTLAAADKACVIGEQERRLLCSAQSPIVIVPAKGSSCLAPSVAPGNPDIGVMLPYSPLHHLLLEAVGVPLVATSGNLSEDPICIDEQDAVAKLGAIADYFLVHDRPIARHVDDSVVRVIGGRESVFRRARGYAPLPVQLSHSVPPILAVGAHQKSAIALSVGASAVLSQHIGDLNTRTTWNVFNRVVDDLSRMYSHQPVAIACDRHPDYRSTAYANSSGLPVIAVQHHYAHILSCMADNHIDGAALGIAWDGTGYGTDGTIWGGEFLEISEDGFSRYASLWPFLLPGGEAAVHEPRRTGLGLLYALLGDSLFEGSNIKLPAAFTDQERKTLAAVLKRGINAPVTSSMGRLFDGVAAVLGVRQKVRHEGQAAMELEYRAHNSDDDGIYDIPLAANSGILKADWRPMLSEIIKDQDEGTAIEAIARRFHNSLSQLVVTVAESAGAERVVLSGGCFQNRLLTEGCIARLRAAGFQPYWHQNAPPNDGGIALGQLVGAAKIIAAQEIIVNRRISAT